MLPFVYTRFRKATLKHPFTLNSSALSLATYLPPFLPLVGFFFSPPLP